MSACRTRWKYDMYVNAYRRCPACHGINTHSPDCPHKKRPLPESPIHEPVQENDHEVIGNVSVELPG